MAAQVVLRGYFRPMAELFTHFFLQGEPIE